MTTTIKTTVSLSFSLWQRTSKQKSVNEQTSQIKRNRRVGEGKCALKIKYVNAGIIRIYIINTKCCTNNVPPKKKQTTLIGNILSKMSVLRLFYVQKSCNSIKSIRIYYIRFIALLFLLFSIHGSSFCQFSLKMESSTL